MWMLSMSMVFKCGVCGEVFDHSEYAPDYCQICGKTLELNPHIKEKVEKEQDEDTE